jgi:hypothetical protein
MMKTASASVASEASLSRRYCSLLSAALALTASCNGTNKGGDFDGENAIYGPKTATTQVSSTLTVAPASPLGSLLPNTGVAQTTTVIGQKVVAGTSYDRLATTRIDDPTKSGEYWVKQNADNTVDFAGFLHSSLVGGIVPAASMTFTSPIKVNLDAPLGQPQAVSASGTLTLTDSAATSNASVSGQYQLVEKSATVVTGVGTLSGCSHFSGQATSDSAGIPAVFQGQVINADLWYHPSFGVVAFNTPDIGIGTVMTGSNDCGSVDSFGYKIIRKVGVVDASSSFNLDTYDCDGNQLAADKNTHAKMLLELRWVDETQAKTDTQPVPAVEFGVPMGYFPNTMTESPASVFHPEENGKGFKYWYSYVNQADKNGPGDNSTAYHIKVDGVTGLAAVRVTARIYYKVLPSAVGAQHDGGTATGTKDAGASQDTAASGQETILFKMESVEGVSYNPPQITTFTLAAPSYITRVWTYHYAATIGTKSPTVAFKDTTSGTIFGPWPQVGYKTFAGTLGATRSDPGNIPGPPDNYWMAYPAQVVPAGTYQVIDSDPTTWAYTADLGNRGSTWVYGYALSGGGLDGGSNATKDAGVKVDAPSGSVLDASADSEDATIGGPTSCNLIVNGNAEAAIGSADGTPVATPGWTTTGEATAAQYGVSGWPGSADPGPTDRGLNLFSGGPSDATSTLTQTINVAQFSSAIDSRRVTYLLSGWLGGWQSQDDNATLTVTFQSASGVALGTGSIGPVMGSDRAYATGLIQQSSSGSVPSGTRTVLVVLSLVRISGSANDGYADDLSLVFGGTGTSACGVGASVDGGGAGDAAAGGQEAILFKMESVEGVSYNPPQITTFTLAAPSYITRVWTYHYGATIGTKSPTVAFKDTTTGTILGPWPQVGYKTFAGTLGATRNDPGNIPGPPDNYWMAYPGQVVPAGTYQVIDSDPTTWAYTADLGNRGSTWVYGYPQSGGGLDGGVHPADASVGASACGIGSAPVPVGTFDDDFSLGLRSTYWSVTQTTAGLYSVDTTQGDVRLAKIGTNSGPLQNVVVNLTMQNLGGSVAGDFELSVDFANAVLGSGGTDQIELHAFFDDSSYFYDVYDNSSGVNMHVWTGSTQPGFSTAVTGGTLRIARTGATVSAYLNSALVWSSTWTTGRLVGAAFVLQLQPGSDDNESVRFDNFHLKGGCVSP